MTWGGRRLSNHSRSAGGRTSSIEHIGTIFFFFSSRRRHTRLQGDWSSDVCSSDLCSATNIAMVGTPGRSMCPTRLRGDERQRWPARGSKEKVEETEPVSCRVYQDRKSGV